jgi:ABC-type sugar transport system substrate-binding protein
MAPSGRKWTRYGALALVAAVAIVLVVVFTTGGGDDSSKAGTGQASSSHGVTYRGWADPNGKKGFHLAYVCVPVASPSTVANNEGAELSAKHFGDSLTHISVTSADEQLTAIERVYASTNPKYDGLMVCPINENVICQATTKSPPIPVVFTNSPGCNASPEGYTPGTVGYSGPQTVKIYEDYLSYMFKQLKPGTQVGIVANPPTLSITQMLKTAVENVGPRFPDIKVVRFLPASAVGAKGDVAGGAVQPGIEQMNTLLTSYPKIGAVFSQFNQNTLGVISALKAAGKKPGDVKVYGYGSTTQEFDYIKQGWISGLLYGDTKNQTAQAIELLVAQLQGRDHPQVVDITRHPGLPGHRAYVDRSNVDKFTPFG